MPLKRVMRTLKEVEGIFGSLISAVASSHHRTAHVMGTSWRRFFLAACVKQTRFEVIIVIFIRVNSTYCKHKVYSQAVFRQTTAPRDKTFRVYFHESAVLVQQGAEANRLLCSVVLRHLALHCVGRLN